MQNNNKKKIVMILKEQRNSSLSKNKDHFNDVYFKQSIYVNSEEAIMYRSKTLPYLTLIEQELIRRDLTILRRTEREGYIKVDWSELMSRKHKKGFAILVNKMVRDISAHFPHIYTKWNSDQVANIYKEKEGREIITVLGSPLNVRHTSNDPYFLEVNNKQKKFFENGIKNFYSHINEMPKLSREHYIEVGAMIHVLRDTCSKGLIIVDWDRFFNLKYQQIIDLIFGVVPLINKNHNGCIHKGTLYQKEVEVENQLLGKPDLRLDYVY